MSLICCPECSNMVSDKAKICVHCGYPLAEHVSNFCFSLNSDGKSFTISGNGNRNVNHLSIPEVYGQYPVTSIAKEAFCDFDYLEEVELPATIIEIGEAAFRMCGHLKSINLPDQIKSIGREAFYECTELNEVLLPPNLAKIGEEAFSRCSFYSVRIPRNITIIGDSAFEGCDNLIDVSFPYGLKSIGDGAFSNCTSLELVWLPESVERIGDAAFSGCIALSKVEPGLGVMPLFTDSTDSEKEYDVYFPEEISYIGDDAFSDCPLLKSFRIPKSADIIGDFLEIDSTTVKTIGYTGNQEEWERAYTGIYESLNREGFRCDGYKIVFNSK